MKIFEASFVNVLLRYYLMMAIIVISFVIGAPYLAFLAFPVFILAILGIKIDLRKSAHSVLDKAEMIIGHSGNINQPA